MACFLKKQSFSCEAPCEDAPVAGPWDQEPPHLETSGDLQMAHGTWSTNGETMTSFADPSRFPSHGFTY